GFLGVGGLVVAALVQMGIASVSDRTRSPLGKRLPYLLGGSAFLCIGLVALGLAPNYAILFLAWLFIQGSINIGYGPYQALIQDLVPAHRVGVASSYKILSDAAGALLLIFLAGELLGLASGSPPGIWIWLALGILGASMLITTGVTSSAVIARQKELPDVPVARPEPGLGLHPQLSRFLVSRLLIITAIAAFAISSIDAITALGAACNGHSHNSHN
ncbi:MFS transporter, partial [bacterium]|nr:MFS transporter [bacterium]